MTARPLARSLNDAGVPHGLEEHLQGVARLAADFARAFDTAGFAECAGLWHDLGKNALDFQAKVSPAAPSAAEAHVEDAKAPGRVDHSSAGAIHAVDWLGAGLGLPLPFPNAAGPRVPTHCLPAAHPQGSLCQTYPRRFLRWPGVTISLKGQRDTGFGLKRLDIGRSLCTLIQCFPVRSATAGPLGRQRPCTEPRVGA
jgi:hypothetical protein